LPLIKDTRAGPLRHRVVETDVTRCTCLLNVVWLTQRIGRMLLIFTCCLAVIQSSDLNIIQHSHLYNLFKDCNFGSKYLSAWWMMILSYLCLILIKWAQFIIFIRWLIYYKSSWFGDFDYLLILIEHSVMTNVMCLFVSFYSTELEKCLVFCWMDFESTWGVVNDWMGENYNSK